jgi:nucleotide-binding universal stress UspA family protein
MNRRPVVIEFRRVLCPMDFSETSLRALRLAAAFAMWYVTARALTGCVHETIVQRAQTLLACLIVVGTHGRSGFSRVFLGSVTEKVLRTAPCPVLMVTATAASADAAAASLKRNPCPLDYSPSASRANTQHVLRAPACPVLTVRA